MKLPQWFVDLYKDDGSQWLTVFLLLGTPLFQVATYFANVPHVWRWEAIACGWGFYFVLFLPIAYLNRNTK